MEYFPKKDRSFEPEQKDKRERINATKESISQRQEEYQKAVMNVAQVYEKASPEEKAEADKFFAR